MTKLSSVVPECLHFYDISTHSVCLRVFYLWKETEHLDRVSQCSLCAKYFYFATKTWVILIISRYWRFPSQLLFGLVTQRALSLYLKRMRRGLSPIRTLVCTGRWVGSVSSQNSKSQLTSFFLTVMDKACRDPRQLQQVTKNWAYQVRYVFSLFSC